MSPEDRYPAWEKQGQVYRLGCGAEDAVILLHEIYGVNGHMLDVAAWLAARGLDVYCPDLLGVSYGYDREEAAYAHYMRVGFAAAAAEAGALAGLLAGRYRRIYLVGYSAGATVAWLLSCREGFAGAVGYYGSRIRDFCDLTPACPVLLFFPACGEAFSVPALAETLAVKDGVEVHILSGMHGFADRRSSRFDASAARAADELTAAFVSGDARVVR
ncbi:dienelactone hydrolase family protein [Anaeroselena agilis]|uniref:Dienelactone hydrolase family protein n=1 Tax=Anaeroselena agilis TaxID=3063788 RepID=A0ABU3P3W8_9FIRM|nr:dienelactone hydrolase family protein [Selenomonadales bacterium 4137-cl]